MLATGHEGRANGAVGQPLIRLSDFTGCDAFSRGSRGGSARALWCVLFGGGAEAVAGVCVCTCSGRRIGTTITQMPCARTTAVSAAGTRHRPDPLPVRRCTEMCTGTAVAALGPLGAEEKGGGVLTRLGRLLRFFRLLQTDPGSFSGGLVRLSHSHRHRHPRPRPSPRPGREGRM